MLSRYFQRQAIKVAPLHDAWHVQTQWTSNPAYYIDPKLSAGLNIWPDRLTTASIPLAVKQDQGFLLGLNDCWSLLSWSLKLQQWRAAGNSPQRINLIHLDSHTDLNSPRLSLLNADDWQDLLTQKPFDLFDPHSVASAVISGAIGIGSFICPLFVAGIATDVYHLSPPQHFRFEPDQYGLILELERNDQLFGEAVRPSLKVSRTHSRSSYTLTDNLASICRSLDKHYPVFLHIDLDYFNNRYDGRPDWRNRLALHDPKVDEVLELVDQVFQQLHDSDIHLVDISVGVSPGFFPAELWQPTLQRIRRWTEPAIISDD